MSPERGNLVLLPNDINMTTSLFASASSVRPTANNNTYYQNPCTGEQWTEQQHLEYIAWQESQIEKDRENDCEDCYGCEKCEG